MKSELISLIHDEYSKNPNSKHQISNIFQYSMTETKSLWMVVWNFEFRSLNIIRYLGFVILIFLDEIKFNFSPRPVSVRSPA